VPSEALAEDQLEQLPLPRSILFSLERGEGFAIFNAPVTGRICNAPNIGALADVVGVRVGIRRDNPHPVLSLPGAGSGKDNGDRMRRYQA